MLSHPRCSEPVSTYGDALSWLFKYSHCEEWLFDEGQVEAGLPLEVRLVAAMFWVNEADVVRDLRRLWNKTLAPATPPYRHRRYAGWR